MTMRIMESDGDVMLGTCRGPNSEEALSIPMMLLRRMTKMESDGDVMLGTCRGPHSEEALSIPMMLLRGMTNRYTFVKLGLFITLP